MALWILRGCFFLVAAGLGATFANNLQLQTLSQNIGVFLLFTIGAAAAISLDVLVKKKRIDFISSVYFGLLVGLFLTYIIGLAIAPVLVSDDPAWKETLRTLIMSFVGIIVCYTCVSVLWQTKDDFRFVIPYVEFAKEVKGLKPYVLDTSVVIDGRIADLVETGIIDSPLVMPRFVLSELQNIADSSDKLRRARGRRGLDVLNRLRNNPDVDLQVIERELPSMEGEPVDMKLLILARELDAKVVTGDYNLNKVAKLQNVAVINLNEIANSIKPVFLPGEAIQVKVVKAGEEHGQGIGYLDDGTMVVVEDGRSHIGQQVSITVTSMLQTNAGRMVFGRLG